MPSVLFFLLSVSRTENRCPRFGRSALGFTDKQLDGSLTARQDQPVCVTKVACFRFLLLIESQKITQLAQKLEQSDGNPVRLSPILLRFLI